MSQSSLPETESLALIATEQVNPETRDIDRLSSLAILQRINAEDALLHRAVQKALPEIAAVVDRIASGFKRNGRLLYFGAGTSGRLGVLDASECPPTFGAPAEQVQGIIAGGDRALRFAVEGAEDNEAQGYQDAIDCGLTSDDVVVGLSASGYAPYVYGVIRAAKERGAFSACIVCHGKSRLAGLVDQAIVVEVGPEVVTGSTRMKAGSAQKMVLNMLSTASMIQIGKTYENLMVDVQPTNAKLKARAARIVQALAGVDETNAEAALAQSQYQVKAAIVMLKKKCSLDQANALLSQYSGKLRPALESL
ncbi:MAG: N-acetylmuramic acid 6-phosphate etherase [Vampirovibrionales bacterium]|nr:N-acetylmuramic acid 6-phosphate etherase [Vampirovibrionales bacterium]